MPPWFAVAVKPALPEFRKAQLMIAPVLLASILYKSAVSNIHAGVPDEDAVKLEENMQRPAGSSHAGITEAS